MVKQKLIVAKAKKGKPIRQVAAIPFRLDAEGKVEVLLITSNTTKRFIVPKGWPMKGKSGKKTAAIEAREEAGVSGKMLKTPLGTYDYWKRLKTRFVKIRVTVHMLKVEEVLADWEESAKRHRAWLSPEDAALLVDEPELGTLVRSIDFKGVAAAA
ncbi:MAG: NUDIX hydrolase [Alphaproteobacteria bacterium]|jgi:8-oxo-dGTP pyrophosphatase MutT (NUDIX family)|nr:NUDIX hydrolase [Alphaproteobacteria bacterium]MBU0803949.1 NUDIX hydrolase [Alphaproteobacteria bacterium]MBU0872754.1 NUDIX hydrolase [Alphaproteobacteria bacterium]MBU1402876.1 NUDIX hydrolase [Alphaproteobacteria bacterium]MBU1593518.1 NUDIX hydrolase [Alphaproteobacteria bacterium]